MLRAVPGKLQRNAFRPQAAHTCFLSKLVSSRVKCLYAISSRSIPAMRQLLSRRELKQALKCGVDIGAWRGAATKAWRCFSPCLQWAAQQDRQAPHKDPCLSLICKTYRSLPNRPPPDANVAHSSPQRRVIRGGHIPLEKHAYTSVSC